MDGRAIVGRFALGFVAMAAAGAAGLRKGSDSSDARPAATSADGAIAQAGGGSAPPPQAPAPPRPAVTGSTLVRDYVRAGWPADSGAPPAAGAARGVVARTERLVVVAHALVVVLPH